VRTGIVILLLSARLLVGPEQAVAQPQLLRAKVVEHSAQAGLQPAIQDLLKADSLKTAPAWIAYGAPIIPGERHMCCFYNAANSRNVACCGACRLEPSTGQAIIADRLSDCRATLASIFFVFLRARGGRIDQVRTFSLDCTIDAAGATVYWLTGVLPAQSIAYLESLLEPSDTTGSHRPRSDDIVSAIALHADPAADRTLEKLVQPGQPGKVRGQAAFWIGNSRGSRGLDILIPLINSDNDRHFLDEAIFAISQSEERDRAFKKLVQFARRDPRSEVREQALFWLAQEAGEKAAGVITESIENDPETDVKKKAVFALSELPKDEGVPLLIDQARKNPNPVVRKEAIFWLGQSEDPRALDFITSILEH
jgi:HEAT repeats